MRCLVACKRRGAPSVPALTTITYCPTPDACQELERLMEFIEPTITDRELRHFMLMVDIDGSGEVSLEEFTRAVRGAVMAEAGDRKADPSAAGDADVVRVDDIIRRL